MRSALSRRGVRGGRRLALALALCVLTPALVSSAAATTVRAGSLEIATASFGAVTVPDVSRFPLGPRPLPEPVLVGALPRLRIQRVDGAALLDVQPFDRHGAPLPEAFARIEELFAAKGGAHAAVHPRLVELLITISSAFDGATIRLVSAHREPGRGTRKSSHHVTGRAADIAILGVGVRDIKKAAERLGAGGVGLYPHFVHVDVRAEPPYRWAGGWGRRGRGR